MINHLVTVIGILLLFTKCGADSSCCHNVSLFYLDAAADLIAKAKGHFPKQLECGNLSRNASDCSELLEMGYKKNGVYTIWPQSRVVDGKPLEVYCDMETDGGGWTLIQRRGPFGRAADYFYKDWKSYKQGFGDIENEFWLGNENIFALTNQRLYSVRFDLKDTENETRYAHYVQFWIDDEYSRYILHIGDYRGDAGDSMAIHNKQKFSTKDEDNDEYSAGRCAEIFKGGWWFKECRDVHLNGLNPKGKLDKTGSGLIWRKWKGLAESLLSTEIKIRPTNFRPPRAFFNETPL